MIYYLSTIPLNASSPISSLMVCQSQRRHGNYDERVVIGQEKRNQRRDQRESLVPPTRIERATQRLGNACSIQLSYGGVDGIIHVLTGEETA